MASLLIRALNRFRPREGWAPFLLTVAALLCPPAALLQANHELGAETFLILTALAAIVGLRLARSRLSARGATALGGLLGGGLATIAVGRLLPSLSLLWAEMTYTVDWLGLGQQGKAGLPLPFATAARFFWQRLSDLGVRLWWWSQTIASGGPARDPIAFVLLAAFLAWTFGLFATWHIYRRRSALLGLLPSGTAVATISFFGGGPTTAYLFVYLFCTLWLIAACHLWTRRDHWQETNTDYPGDLGLELVIALAPGLTLILVLAALFPVIRPRQVGDAFWELMIGPWSSVERVSERLFGPIEGSWAGGEGLGGSLPRAHLLGGGPELDETVVLYVITNDPPPPAPAPPEPEATGPGFPLRYWRSVTYDTYSGRGWMNGPLEPQTSPSYQPLDPNPPPGFEMYQQFELVTPGESQVYAVNAPWRIDHAVQSWWRAPGDLAQLTGDAKRYTVISRPPEATIADLRDASPIVPPDAAERYLALPDKIPQRVLDLAEQVVGNAETRYDQAQAIETYLRAYTYTLDLPDPPKDRDVVDYFLFDLQKGYCDYYASAMVVMARAIGIPARLATGYAQGTYDRDKGRWVVTEKNGHSWVEIYFDGIGWVEFEPTAGLRAPDWPGGEGLSRPVVPPLPPRTVRWWQRVPWGLVIASGVLAFLMGIIFLIWRPRQHRVLAASDLVLDRYSRMLHWGVRLKQPLQDGQTPFEYGTALGNVLRSRGQNSRWAQVRRASAKAPPEVERLAETFVRAQYSPTPITDRESWRIRDLWTRLRRYLCWLWLALR